MLPVQKVKNHLRHPSLALQFINSSLTGNGNPRGIDIFEEDWDNLIILDACRYDFFDSVVESELSGTLEKRESKASATPEWVRQNFSDRRLFDTVYVSANGWYRRLQDKIDSSLHDTKWLYQNKYRNEMGTVEPQLVVNEALQYAKEYPHKRLLIHFVQPHKPYLGPTAERYFSEARGINLVELMTTVNGATSETLQQAYQETLEYMIPELKRLIKNLDGKTVVSADHGELLGERYYRLPLKNYGHATGVYVPKLIEVPWFICEDANRRHIVSESPQQQTEIDERELQEHLKVMGYVD